MAETTWKQVVYDIADAYREADGSTAKIPVGQLADKVREGVGVPYSGDNPLTIGANGHTFPAKTLIKEELQIINGVNGEDLTETEVRQDAAVDDLYRKVMRKVADHKGEGQYIWKKMTTENGDFIDYVVSNDTEAFPNGGIHTDDYWYKLIVQPVDLADEIDDLIPSNIRKNKNIFGVNGDMEEGVQVWSEKGTFSGFNNYHGHTITTANSGPKRIFGGGTKHYSATGHSQSMLLNGTTVTIGDTEDGDETASIEFGANSVKINRTSSFLSMSGTVSYWITNAEI